MVNLKCSHGITVLELKRMVNRLTDAGFVAFLETIRATGGNAFYDKDTGITYAYRYTSRSGEGFWVGEKDTTMYEDSGRLLR